MTKLADILFEGSSMLTTVELSAFSDGSKKEKVLAKLKKEMAPYADFVSSKMGEDKMSYTVMVPVNKKADFVSNIKSLVSGVATVKSM